MIFSYVVAQKRFLVRLEIYWQKVDMTDSSHQFIQQTELYQCPCIAKLNWNSLQNPKYQWKYYISRALQLQPCHNALKYWKQHIFYVLDVNSKLEQNQSCFVPHDWSIGCCGILLALLARSETHRCFPMFYEVSKALLIFCKIFHINKSD